ncbi:MAG: asparagine synthase-related protein, partial [Minisyncoccia bacterium]
KLGFPTPIRDWLTDKSEVVYDTILSNKYIVDRFDTKVIEKIIDEHVSKVKDNSRKIYTLLMLALWYNSFIEDGN